MNKLTASERAALDKACRKANGRTVHVQRQRTIIKQEWRSEEKIKVTGDIVLYIDVAKLLQEVGYTAIRNRGRRSKAMHGAIEAVAVNVTEEPQP